MMEAPAESASTGEPMTAAAPRIDLATLHLWTAMLGMALQPISTATGNIGFGIAVGGALLRPAEMLQASRELWQQPWIRWLLAWLAWSWLSLIWSSDRAFGVDQFHQGGAGQQGASQVPPPMPKGPEHGNPEQHACAAELLHPKGPVA